MKLFTFYTPGTPYEEEARQCWQAFGAFGLDVREIALPDRGDWMLNALARAPRLHELAREYPHETVVLLDADVRPVRDPELFRQPACFDMACEDRGAGVPAWRRYSAGVVLFAPTWAGRKALAHWAWLCRRDPRPADRLREQVYLYDTVELFHIMRAKILNIGNRYNRKPEDVRRGDDTVMIHHVASRRLRKQMEAPR